MTEPVSQPAWSLQLPLAETPVEGGMLFCPNDPCPANDARFAADWEAPLIWKWVSSKLRLDRFYKGAPTLHFNLQKRTPPEIWKTGWHLWYDAALVTREEVPADLTLTAELALEEVTTGYGSDNNVHVAPWAGIIARMQDIRRYYFLTLEYPEAIVLYRREDDYWLPLARKQVDIEAFASYRLTLKLRGERLEAWVGDRMLFARTDYAYTRGKAGLRASCVAMCTHFSLTAEAPAVERFHILRDREERARADHAAKQPAVVHDGTWNLPEGPVWSDGRLGPVATPDGDPQLLINALDPETNARTLTLFAWQATTPLWQRDDLDLRRYELLPPNTDGRRDVYGFSGDRIVVLDGRTGETKQELPFTDLPEAPRKMAFLPDDTADLDGVGSPRQLIFTAGANDPNLWVLDEDLTIRWHSIAPSGMGHGNHVSVWDVDGDGREEIFAGGVLFDHTGRIRWRQEELLKHLTVPNGGHVDASQMGPFAGPDTDPVLHCQGSSGGHLVANARTGETLIDHPQGHVQGGCAAALVPGEPGLQVAACNRWGNYGLMGIYAADGRRLARSQPNYRNDSPTSVNWDGTGTELLLLAHDPSRAGLYDYRGRRLVDLQPYLPDHYTANIANRERDLFTQPLGKADPRDALILRFGRELRIVRPDPDTRPTGRCYAPYRRSKVSWPGWV